MRITLRHAAGIAVLAVAFGILGMVSAQAEIRINGNKVCRQSDYDQYITDQNDAANRLMTEFGTRRLEDLAGKTIPWGFQKEDALNNAIRLDTILKMCREEIPFEDLAYYCDSGASPAYGFHRLPPVKGFTRIGSEGYCAAADEFNNSGDGLLRVEGARTYIDVYFRDEKGFAACGSDYCSSKNFRAILEDAASTNLSSGKAYFCQAMAAFPEMLTPSQADYQLAAQRAHEAWNDDRDGYAADCLAMIYGAGLGVTVDLPAALSWAEKAQSVGVGEDAQIAELQQKISPNNSPSVASTLAPLLVGAATVACILWTGCPHAVGNFAWETAKSAAQREVGNAALDALKGHAPQHQ